MSIISRRIPSGLGYLPNYTVRAHTVRGGLGVEEALGWFYPASTTPPTTTIAPTTVNPNTLPLCSVTPKYQPCRNYIGGSATTSTGSTATTTPATTKPATDWGAIAGGLFSALTPKPAAPAPAAMPGMAYTPPPASGGMSKGTMIAIGVGAVGLLAVVMLTRK
jgi:hypothetical protein